jgi:polyhydroxybutyrate depolymerase
LNTLESSQHIPHGRLKDNKYFYRSRKIHFMKKYVLLLLITLSSLVAKSQLSSDSILIGNNYRSFYFESPKSLKPNGSLIFILHGSGGDGKQLMSPAEKLAQKANSENILLVYPNGYKRYWNECRKAASSLANKENIDEASFFTSMISYFKEKYKINSRQVFAIGLSGGGHMCYKIAMTMPGTLRATTALIANLPDDDNLDCEESKAPIPIMIVNGTADPLNPYEGGMMRSGDFIMGNVRSTDRTFKYWANLAGYTATPKKENVPDNDPTDGKTIERYTYKKNGKPEIVLLKVIGGKHDTPNDIDVFLESWEFFKRQLK